MTKDEENETWKVQIWENRGKLPVTMPVQNIEYGELRSVKSVLGSTQGYEKYLSDDLEFKEYYWTDEKGEGHNSYQIWLPQFNSKIDGYKKINQYFRDAYQEAVAKLTGSVYKYMEGIGRGTFLLKDEDELTKQYDPEQFFLFQEGIGIYYERYAIDCGAAGDYMFIIPWEQSRRSTVQGE